VDHVGDEFTNTNTQTLRGFALRLFLVGGRFGGKQVEEQRNIILGITHLNQKFKISYEKYLDR
jgi:hypothetical protein